jgi:lipid II:glycine glycyltransferase (peptidoglycan interpeptide bridge formation enzyme)
LEKSEEEILKSMHQKTRYNIKLALKKGIVVKEIQNIKNNFDEFWSLMQETESRDDFRLHSKEHYQKMLNLDSSLLKLIGAFYKDKLIAVNIVSFFGDMVTYVHGASSSENRNLMAPYALQWETIKIAKQKGYKYYDFNGIDERKWPGVTRFKKGFSGYKINYLGTFDLVFNSMEYSIYKALRKLRRMASK